MTGCAPGSGRAVWWLRRLRAFWRLPASKGFGTLLVGFAAFCAGSAWALKAGYVNPGDGARLTWVEAGYAVFELLAFQPVIALPARSPLAALFFAVPLAGLLVLGQGLVRLGRAITEREAWERAMASTYHDHVIICGMGQIGYRVAQWLLDLGESVVGVEPRPSRFVDEVRQLKVPVIEADARLPQVLKEAGVERARSIVPCTDDDLVNLNIGLEARRLNPSIKVVLRIFDDRLAENVRTGFGIHTSFSVTGLGAPAFAAAAMRAPVDYAFSFAGEEGRRTLLTICKFTVAEGSSLAGYTLARIEEEFDVSVLMHRKGAQARIHPPGDAVLGVGDGFVVSAELAALTRLQKLTPATRDLLRQQGKTLEG